MWRITLRFATAALLAAVLITCGACAPATPTPGITRTPQGTLPQGPVTAVPGGAANVETTAGARAASGRTLYVGFCASCHGDQGQGVDAPALIGGSANLSKFGTAADLSNYLVQFMPLNAPGSLQVENYVDITIYLALSNGYVTSNAVVAPDGLTDIPLKK